MFLYGCLDFAEDVDLVAQLDNLIHSPLRIGWFQHTLVVYPHLGNQSLKFGMEESFAYRRCNIMIIFVFDIQRGVEVFGVISGLSFALTWKAYINLIFEGTSDCRS